MMERILNNKNVPQLQNRLQPVVVSNFEGIRLRTSFRFAKKRGPTRSKPSRSSGEALYKNQVQRPIDIRVVSGEKEEERRLQMCVVGVGEAVLDYTVLIH
jgi:hypothetical protein